ITGFARYDAKGQSVRYTMTYSTGNRLSLARTDKRQKRPFRQITPFQGQTAGFKTQMLRMTPFCLKNALNGCFEYNFVFFSASWLILHYLPMCKTSSFY
ncbi:MAG: hypothetical protein IKX40_06780, partial [Thermoguttaceae bacterium]|nr:hypothetical protein [Thermoguttaceae bacterium]